MDIPGESMKGMICSDEWIISQRMIAAVLTGVELTGFLVSIPGRPGREFLEWSDWKPRPQAPNPPWPDTKALYRFRVRMEKA